MAQFSGFPSGKVRLTPVPASFFTDLLPQIDSLAELKVTLYALWHLDQQQGPLRFLTYDSFSGDRQLMAGFGSEQATAQQMLAEGLQKALQRGTLLCAQPDDTPLEEQIFLLNTARGRAAVQAYRQGEWQPGNVTQVVVDLEHQRPNIFKLYEDNIGPLTPIIADMLQDAEKTYPADWIEEAIRKAVQNNVRRWRYVEAILQSWKEERHDGTHRRDSEKGSQRYLEGPFADFIER
jgi:DnaD/phage-associated family protein